MSPTLFNNRIKAAGLHLACVGLQAVTLLEQLQAEPYIMEFVRRPGCKNNSISAQGRPQEIATLIRHGLAKLREARDGYEITAKGAEYLQKVKTAKIIEP